MVDNTKEKLLVVLTQELIDFLGWGVFGGVLSH